MLKKITKSPFLNLFSGFTLLTTSTYETIVTFGEEAIGAHHGVLIFSLIQIVKVIPEIMHGLKQIESAGKIKNETLTM